MNGRTPAVAFTEGLTKPQPQRRTSTDMLQFIKKSIKRAI
jgi:hypothetical protein